MNSTRRGFLKATAALSATTIWSPTLLPANEKRVAVNDQLRVGVIGIGVRGKYLIGNLPAEARVIALCDCATSRIGSALEPKGTFAEVLADFQAKDAKQCATFQDYRKMLDEVALDAVIIATPDHHHVVAGMRALQAGLDVYLEKPLTVCVREGRLLANLVKQTGRVLQVGSQQRTMEMNRIGCEFIRSGGLGRITKVELPNYPGPLAMPNLPAEPIPDGLDWNLFLGPTQVRPHNRKLWVKDAFKVGDLLWRGWDLWQEYSGHIMTNWGAHSVDMVQYALGQDDSGPVEIRSLPLEDIQAVWQQWDHKTPAPTTAEQRRFWPVVMKYENGTEVHFVHGPDYIRFHGERGMMKMRRNRFQTDPPGLVKELPDPKVVARWQGGGHVARPHLQNWLDCIRSRRVPNAPVEVGHRTATICHLANLARQSDTPLVWNPQQEQFVDNEQANTWLDRPRREGFELPAI